MTSSEIKAAARELGFDLCGIAPAVDHPELRFFEQWLERKYAGEMAYLRRSADRRADVRHILPSAKSVIVTGTIYNVDRPYSTECADPSRAHIARYAWGDDYHRVIERRLDALIAWMRGASPEPFEARRYVDTGPVQERVYARHAGIGWIGKNTCVINPALGSWLFLGEIICSLAFEPDHRQAARAVLRGQSRGDRRTVKHAAEAGGGRRFVARHGRRLRRPREMEGSEWPTSPA